MEDTQFEIDTFISSTLQNHLELKVKPPHLQFQYVDIIADENERYIDKSWRDNISENTHEVINELASDGQVITLRGIDVGDVPTEYQVRDLRTGEMPVKGTYIDKRIIPGFKYHVRLIGSRNCYMFYGRALKLQRIGMGYGKRLTFEGDSALNNQNYFWSDNDPDGYAFSLVAVEVGDKFDIYDEETRPVGSAVVDSVETNQVESSTEINEGAITKRVHVTFICSIHYTGQPHGIKPTCSESEVQVSGLAILVKPKHSTSAKLQQIENIELPYHGACVFHK